MPITINGSGTITGASTLATTVASPTLTTPNINSAQFATVTGTAPIYPCRAWVNFNGTGTVAIRASGNVSSITDNGVGYYIVNFTTAMPDVNYAIVNNASDDGAAATISCTSGTWGGTSQTTTSAIIFVGVAGAGNDRTYVGVSIFR
jgi:hypothetical protein